MVKNKVNIYFDESGKRGDNGPMLMGAILVPKYIYDLEDFTSINERLRNEEIKYHFTDYNGNRGHMANYIEKIRVFSKYLKYCNLNIISYRMPNSNHIDQQTVKNMLYTKFPERVFYGLLRNNGEGLYIDADIYMEEASEYNEMIKTLPMTLNTQSIYRGEKFKITNSKLVPKNVEIGVEFTDTILGMIRQIIMSINEEGPGSNAKRAKNSLIMECLNIDGFYDFLSNIGYYEWCNTSTLREVKFENYLKFFVSKQLAINSNKSN
ncbi:MAG: DUF3800 domain-containing protein [Paraclostridium sp.]